MEILPGIVISLDLVVGIMVKVLMVMLSVMSLLVVRQASLMDRVVNIPIGGNFKILAWTVMILALMLTAIVIVG